MAHNPRRPTDSITCQHCGQEFRAITMFHLRSAHDYDGDHPVEDYKKRFRLKTAKCLQGRKRISEAKTRYWARRGQGWTPAKLVAEIRRLHRNGRRLRRGKIPVRVYEAGRRYFGTWESAVKKAGLNYVEVSGVHRWSVAKVIEEIKGLAACDVPLSGSYVQRHHPTLYTAAVKQFPRSWAKALRAAGFDATEHKMPRGRWNKTKAEEWVRNRVAKGKSIVAGKVPTDLYQFVNRRLGTRWVEFVESLGIKYPGRKLRRDWTKAKVIAELKRLKAEGHRVNYAAVKATYQALVHQVRKHFRSWDRALATASV